MVEDHDPDRCAAIFATFVENGTWYVPTHVTRRMAEALAAGTIRAAELIRVEDDYGSIEPGKAADLVILGSNPLEDIDAVRDIEAVILGGTVHDRAPLDAMLERAVAAAAAVEPAAAD